jgi:hypothetical protein
MKREDALAIADYLKSIPPIKNKIEEFVSDDTNSHTSRYTRIFCLR